MKKKLLGAAKLGISAMLIAYLYTIVDFNATFVRIKSINLGFMLIALILLVTQVAASTLKWKLILRADGLSIPFLRLLKVYYIGNFFSLFLPSSFGGDLYRVYALGSDNQHYGKTTSSVLFDRLSGLLALLTIALMGYVSLPGGKYDLVLLMIYLLGIGSFFLLTSKRTIDKLQDSRIKLIRKSSVLITSFRTYRLDYRMLCQVLVISLIFQFMVVVINKIYALSLSIDVPFGELLVIIPLVYLTEVLPISINGIGIRDSAFVFFFMMIEHSKEEGLAMALTVLTMRYISGLMGGLVLLYSVIHQHFLKKAGTS